MKKILLWLLGVVFSQLSFSQSPEYIKGEVLVQFSNKNHQNNIQNIEKKYNLNLTQSEYISDLMNVWLLRFDNPNIDAKKLSIELRRETYIQVAQANHIIKYRTKEPNDPLFVNQWQYVNDGSNGGLLGADIKATQAWDITTGGLTSTGDTIVVCVIDDGIDLNHEDLGNNLWKNFGEIAGNGIDDDGNGYVDDFDGWNADNNNGSVSGAPFFGGFHGTPVAGIVGAKGNNGVGVAGVNWDVKLMIVVGGGNEAQAIAAYTYPWKMRKIYNETNGEKGAFVIATNASWGIDGGNPLDAPIWCAFYDSLGVVGILNAGATANVDSNIDLVGDLPTGCSSEYLISVTNIGRNDVKVTQAGYGLNTIDLGAFGEDTYTLAKPNFFMPESYAGFGGTSGATPHVAGTIALLYSVPCEALMKLAKEKPDTVALLMKKFILDGTDYNESLQNITVTGGRLNMYKAVLELQKFECENTGLNQLSTQSFAYSVSPNPAETWVRVASEAKIEKLELIDLSGRILYTQNIEQNNEYLFMDVSQIKSGIYILRAKSGNLYQTHKLIKQ